MRPVAAGLKVAPVLKKARKSLGDEEPLVVVVPRKNMTYVF